MLNFAWPTDYPVITSPFGWRPWPYPYNHDGMDCRAPFGSPIYAAYDGVVSYAGPARGYGTLIIVNHPTLGHDIQTLYAHMASFKVKTGESVKKGQKLALAGHRGLGTAPHLHFAVIIDQKNVDPMKYVMFDRKVDYKRG